MASNSEALGIGCAVFFIVGVLLTIKPPWVADKAYVQQSSQQHKQLHANSITDLDV